MNASIVTAQSRHRATARPPLLGELIVVGALLFVYDRIKRVAHSRPAVAEAHGRLLLRIERALGLDIERSLNRWLAEHHVLSLLASYSYEVLWWTTTLAVLAAVYWLFPERYRAVRTTLVAINLVALLIFFVCPVMPPRLLPGAVYVDAVAAAGFGAKHVGGLPADQYAAMPSLHVAWATFTAWAVWFVSPRWLLRVMALLLPLITVLDVIATGNHYVLDAAAGAALTALAAAGVLLAVTWRQTTR